MKRVILKLGLVDDPEPPLALHAAARDPDLPGRWFNARLSLSTLIGILTLGGSVVTGFVTLKVTQANQAAVIDDLRGQVQRLNRRVTEDYVTRHDIDGHNADVDQRINILLQAQQQIYGVLLHTPKGNPTP